jgi:hypothetical protein
MSTDPLLGEAQAEPEHVPEAAPQAAEESAAPADQSAPTDQEQAAPSEGSTEADGGDSPGPEDEKQEGSEEAGKSIEFDLALPDGSLLPDDHVGAVSAFAQEAGLNAEQAQAVLERDSAMASESLEKWWGQVEGWRGAVVSDPEIGGDNLPATVAAGKAVLAEFFDTGFVKELIEAGYDRHPAFVKGLVKIHSTHMAEPEHIARGGQAASGDESPRYFKNSPTMYGGSLGERAST